jgi:antitoxin component YwqK of YwqJK toxin-antitoxin module
MKHSILILFLFVTLNSYTALQAQESQTLYVGKAGQYVDNLDSAAFIRILKAPDSGSTLFGVQEYNKKGRIMSMGYCKDPRRLEYEGEYASFHPNGKRKSTGLYSNGKIKDIEYLFYPSGKLYVTRLFKYKSKNLLGQPEVLLQKVLDSIGNVLLTDGNGYYIKYNEDFTSVEVEGTYVNSKWHGTVKGFDKRNKSSYIETYDKGKLISGISTDTTGKQYPYKELIVAGEFEQGAKPFNSLLWKKIARIASAKKLEGKTFVSFTLNHLGQIKSAKIDRSLDPEISKEILLILNSGIVFKPSLFRGMPMSIRYNLPISVDFKQTARDPFADLQNMKPTL